MRVATGIRFSFVRRWSLAFECGVFLEDYLAMRVNSAI